MPFNFQKGTIPELIHIEPKVFRDDRGFFAEIYKQTDFATAGIAKSFVQINHSCSQKNVLRGLHYQLQPHGQDKLVSVVVGEIYDVAVDVRLGSPTFGQWAAYRLNAKQKNMLYIPIGFAHGFCVLEDKTEVIYYCSGLYNPEAERGILWNDPALKIEWPVTEPILANKDAQYPMLSNAETNFNYFDG